METKFSGIFIIMLLVGTVIYFNKSSKLIPEYVEYNATVLQREPLVSDEYEDVVEDNISSVATKAQITVADASIIVEKTIKEPAMALIDLKIIIKKLRKEMRSEKDIDKKKSLQAKLVKLKKQRRALRQSKNARGESRSR